MSQHAGARTAFFDSHQPKQYLVALFFLIIFAYQAFLTASFGDPARNVSDERAHLSYALQLRDAPWPPPSFDSLRIYDLDSRAPTSELNYLNHQPLAYYALGSLLARFPGWDLTSVRAGNAAIAVAGYMVYLLIGLRLSLPDSRLVLYALFPCVTYFCGIFASVNFDAVIFLGGCLVYLGMLGYLHQRRRFLCPLLLGIALVSIKLNGLLCAGMFLLALAVSQRAWQRVRPWAAIILTGLACSLPYAWLWWVYGSPAPLTEGQRALLHIMHAQNPAESGWSIPYYVLNALFHFPYGQVGAAHLISIYQVCFGLAGLGLLLQLLRLRQRSSTDILCSASALAFLIVFLIQLIYCYQRYVAFQWFGDYYPRYYTVLLPGFGLFFAAAGTLPVRWYRSLKAGRA